MTRTDRSDRRIVAGVLVTAVLALCAGVLVHAIPGDGALVDCGPSLCAGASGCSATTLAQLHTPAGAALPETPSIAGPVSQTLDAGVVTSGGQRDRSAHALAPRSPPLR